MGSEHDSRPWFRAANALATGSGDAKTALDGMARYLLEAHLLEGRPVAELAKTHGVHRSWIYKLIAR